MYEDGNKNLNWLSLVLKLVLIVIIVFLGCWVFIKVSNNKSAKGGQTNEAEYITNIASMKNAAFEYFTTNKLPDRVGGTEKLTLNQMINQKLLIDFTNDGKTCSLNDSYIQTTKTADGNYALKVNLSCKDRSDFIVTTIEKNSCIVTNTCENKTTEEPKENIDVIDNDPKMNPIDDVTRNTNNNNVINNNNTSNNTNNSSSYVQPVRENTTTTTTVKTTVTIKITCGSSCYKTPENPTPTPTIDKFTVRFNLNGGTGNISNQIVEKGGKAIQPVNPTRNGYTFVEWQLDGQKYNFDTPVTRNITLIAKWQLKEECPGGIIVGGDGFYINYNTNGGNSIARKFYNTTLERLNVVLPTPTRSGYKFMGWYVDKNLTIKANNNGYTITNATFTEASDSRKCGPHRTETTIYAKWQKVDEKVRYYEFYRWSDWKNGYSYNSNAENKRFVETNYKYCKNEQIKDYYSVGYVADWTQTNKTYSYEYQIRDLTPDTVIGLQLVPNSKAYFNYSTSADFYGHMLQSLNNQIYMTNNDASNNKNFDDFYEFKKSALKEQHFTFNVSSFYQADNTYRTGITINYKNHNGLTPYGNTGAYPVPLKFKVSYYYLFDCITSSVNNYSYYRNQGYTGQFEDSTSVFWKHRIKEYTYSTSPSLDGWTATGYSELR